MNHDNEETLGGMVPAWRGQFSNEYPMPSSSAKAKARRHERRKVREVLHQILVEDEG